MLSEVEAVHTAARRYCIAQADLGNPTVGVFHQLGFAVETFTPADFASLDEARERLVSAAAGCFENDRTGRPRDPTARRALEDFGEYVGGLSATELARIEPLPYRRTLSEDEGTILREELQGRWGVSSKGMFYPFDRHTNEQPPSDTQVFEGDAFLDADVQDRLRTALTVLGVSRLWELQPRIGIRGGRRSHSLAPFVRTTRDCEIELALLEPVHDECFWTGAAFEWLVYRSHEDTVTVCGARLLRALREAWPELHAFTPRWAG